MAKPTQLPEDASADLLRRMTAASDDQVVNKVIHFANDDVPRYLENLRRFEEESRKVEILVK